MNIFKKKVTFIANVCPKWRNSKNVVRWISRKYRFWAPLPKQHGKWDQALLKSKRRSVYHIYWSLWRQLSLKKSLLVIWKIFRLCVNTLTAYDKSSVLNREYLKYPIHMQLSEKQKKISEFFSKFLKSRFNFQHIQKKMTFITNVFPKLWTSENVVR